MKKQLIYFACLFTCSLQGLNIAAQTESFDIARFIPPQGWQRIDSNGVVLFHDHRESNGQTTFCQLFLFPSRESNNTAEKNFEEEWDGRVVKATGTKERPTIETGNTPDGWTVTRGHANINQQGVTYTCILYTISGFNRVISILANLAGEDYLAVITGFLNTLELNSKATSATENKPMNTAPVTIQNYNFVMPARWFRQPGSGYILLSQYQTPQYGCLISIFPPQPSSGNLETDAKNIFNQMYPGWQYRYTGEKQHDLSKGYTSQGLEFCKMEAAMQKPRPDGYYFDYEDGDALVIKMDNQIAVIASRHNRGEMPCFCKHQYEYWGNFFNSFTIKNTSAPKINEDVAAGLVGAWQALGSVLLKYIFASNGHYQFIGAYNTSSYISPYLIEHRTSAFKGDGTYSFNGNKLITVKDGKSSTAQFRLEKVNHGGTGWTDRLYIQESFEGKPNEVCYEKQND
jgi:hypothetical protein